MEQHARNLQKFIEEKDYAGLEAYLIANRPNPNSWQEKLRSCTAITLINIATKLRDARAIELLIHHSADSFLDDKGISLTTDDRLYLASFYNDENDRLSFNRQLLVKYSIFRGSLAELKYWHEERDLLVKFASAFTRDTTMTPLIYSSSAGYNDCVEYLVDKVGCDVNEELNRTTPLKAALCNGHITTADLLLKLGANPDREISDPLTYQSTTKRSLIHHLVHMNSFFGLTEDDIKNRIEGLKWALKQGIDFDKNTTIRDDYNTNFDDAPSLVIACSKTYELAELLLNYGDQREKWMNHGGPLLEVIPLGGVFSSTPEKTFALVKLIMPLVNPERKDEHLGNALAAAILYQNDTLERYYRETLGADLKNVTKKDKYAISEGRSFASRLKLARNGVDIFTEQNEAHGYTLTRVELAGKTAIIEGVRRQMKNIIPKSAEIFYEIEAKNTDPKDYEHWARIEHNYISYVKTTKILLLDKYNGKVYKGIPEIEDLVLDLKSKPGEMTTAFKSDPAFFTRFAVFAQVTKFDERHLVLPKGYRIMYNPNTSSNESKNVDRFDEVEGDDRPRRRSTRGENKKKDVELNEDEESEGGGRTRRSARTTKRTIDQVATNEEQTTSNKRRKTRK